MKQIIYQLAEYVRGVRYEDLPPEVVQEAKNRVADVLSIGLSGSRTQAARVSGYVENSGHPGRSTVWGADIATSVELASLANATMTFHLELDDVHRTSHTHPGVSTVPAAVALCQEHGFSGKRLLAAVVAGYDVCIRVGLGVSPSIYVDRTFLAPGVLSPFGAAAAAAYLTDLTLEETAGAIGGASYMAPLSCYEAFRTGAGVKDIIMGVGNQCGVMAARMAKLGFGGAPESIEGAFGFCRTTADSFDISRITRGLGVDYTILGTGVKPYACCRQHHAAIDCMLELRERHGLVLDDVAGVDVRTFSVSSRGNKKDPDSIPAAKYSIPYIMAVSLKYGAAWREQFTGELIADKRIRDFASLVEVAADAEMDALYDEKWPARVTVATRDGRKLMAYRELPKGEPEVPVSEEELKAKVLSLAGDALGGAGALALWENVQSIDRAENLDALTQILKG